MVSTIRYISCECHSKNEFNQIKQILMLRNTVIYTGIQNQHILGHMKKINEMGNWSKRNNYLLNTKDPIELHTVEVCANCVHASDTKSKGRQWCHCTLQKVLPSWHSKIGCINLTPHHSFCQVLLFLDISSQKSTFGSTVIQFSSSNDLITYSF